MLHSELVAHTHEASLYVAAISWTHVFLPLLGGPTLVSVPELFSGHRFGGPFLWFVWLYTVLMTGICYSCFRFADRRAKAIGTSARSMAERLAATLWDNLSKSMAWISAWAWMSATLGSLPTATPLEAICSAAILTLASSGALLAGQRGLGPLAAALRSPNDLRDQLTWLIFFTTWMTGVGWVGALTKCVEAAGAATPTAAAWYVAAAILITRWLWLLNGCGASVGNGAELNALHGYAGSLHAGLKVGLLSEEEPSEAPMAMGCGTRSCCCCCRMCPCCVCFWLPRPSRLLRSALGLSALTGAWLATVALQAAFSALWSTDLWQALGVGPLGVAVDLLFAAATSCASIFAISTVRDANWSQHELAAETVSLAVASGWAWYHALAAIFPALVSPSFLERALGAVALITAMSAVVLRLKPLEELPIDGPTSAQSVENQSPYRAPPPMPPPQSLSQAGQPAALPAGDRVHPPSPPGDKPVETTAGAADGPSIHPTLEGEASSVSPAERRRRLEWIKFYVNSGQQQKAIELGWDGKPFPSMRAAARTLQLVHKLKGRKSEADEYGVVHM
jgi:hypothetical protein